MCRKFPVLNLLSLKDLVLFCFPETVVWPHTSRPLTYIYIRSFWPFSVSLDQSDNCCYHNSPLIETSLRRHLCGLCQGCRPSIEGSCFQRISLRRILLNALKTKQRRKREGGRETTRVDNLNSAGNSSHHSTPWTYVYIDHVMEDVDPPFSTFPWASHKMIVSPCWIRA